MQQGSVVHLWQCHSGDNQNWRMGENDFGSNYSMTIHATPSSNFGQNITTGHSFISVAQNNGYWKLTNTFAFWPDIEGTTDTNLGPTNDINNDNNSGRINNISTNDDNRIDSNKDIYYSSITHNSSDFEGHSWRRKHYFVTKTAYDEIKFMRGWKVSGHDNNYNFLNPFLPFRVCSSYAYELMTKYLNFAPVSGKINPRNIYEAI